MGSDDRSEQYRQDIERIIRHLVEDGGAGGTVDPEGLSLGIPNWEEQTKDRRFAERVKTHGYPLGFAKTQLRVRDRLVEAQRTRVEAADIQGRDAYANAHDAVAWVLDAERFLGSFNQGVPDRFPAETVDSVAERFLAWLDHRGFTVVSKEVHRTSDETTGEGGTSAIAAGGPGDEMHGQPEDAEVEFEDEELVDEEEDEDEVDCPLCEGSGSLGSWAGDGECYCCYGTGKIPREDAESFQYDTFTWQAKDIRQFKADGAPAWLFDSTKYDPRGEAAPGVDWSGLAFSEVDLHGVDLSGANLSGCYLELCDLSHTNLVGVDLTAADIAYVDFRGANMTGANLTDTDLEDAESLEGTLLKDVIGLSQEALAAYVAAGAVLDSGARDED